ncbi:MAG: MSHA pilin protein MshA [Gammaproteobacteria bacterium]|jgi:MSHA pilin protein MshA
MQKSQKGFTLIELVVVIVLLGILGVTALGKFQNLSADAQTAANNGIASELTSGSSINYAASLLGTTGFTALNADSLDCADLVDGSADALLTSTLATSDFTVAGTLNCASNVGIPQTSCTVIGAAAPTGTLATATIICTQ